MNIKSCLLIGVAMLTFSLPMSAAYELVWSDEFDCDELNPTVWTYEIGAGGWGNGESQYYTSRADNLYLQNGKMIIVAKKEDYSGSSYTSARIKSNGKVQARYGKVESLIKTPKANTGVWPAFWMLGKGADSWPYQGEIDIMEEMCTSNTTTWNRALSTYHWNNNGMDGSYSNVNYGQSITFDEEVGDLWRIFGVEWTPSVLIGYVCDADGSNRQNVVTMSTAAATDRSNGIYAFNYEFYMLYNIALGGAYVNYNIAQDFTSCQMQVDWVRIYQDKTDYPQSTLTDNSSSCGTEIDVCTNSFASYTSMSNVCNENNVWNVVEGLASYSGTTITANPKLSYDNMYVVTVGNKNPLKASTEYTLSGTITSTENATVNIYVESNNDNKLQMFNDNEITLTAGQEYKFSISETAAERLDAPALVLSVSGGPADAVYTISNVSLKGSECVTAVNDVVADNHYLVVYPNPISDYAVVESDEVIKSAEILSLNGKVLKQFNFNSDNYEINMSGISSGLYILKAVYTNDNVEITKILKK
jgi:beta-glucanase (GH16 family)